jgi:hypothetical protein
MFVASNLRIRLIDCDTADIHIETQALLAVNLGNGRLMIDRRVQTVLVGVGQRKGTEVGNLQAAEEWIRETTELNGDFLSVLRDITMT